jgi:hypothetical protein
LTVFNFKARQLLFALLALQLNVALAQEAPKVTSYTPVEIEIPANTLRLYLNFSQPMARGQVREKIKLEHIKKGLVKSPFLNLKTELWDTEQRRLTLLFDPGRVKQKVGPNLQVGAPLIQGEQYHLIIDSSMKSAEGIAIGKHKVIPYTAVAAEQRAIFPSDWKVETPNANTREPLTLKFDRLIDTVAAERLIRITTRTKKMIAGRIHSDGKKWALHPENAWTAGEYQVVIHPDLEDVSGNTIRAPFDAKSGTMGKQPEIAKLIFKIGDNI